MKRILTFLIILFASIQFAHAQWPNPKVRWVDVYPVVNMTLNATTQTIGTAFQVPVDIAYGLRVRGTGITKFTGYLRLEMNDISTGNFVVMDSLAVSSATVDLLFWGESNPLNYWRLVYTGAADTDGTFTATLTGSLKYRY